MKNKLNNKKGQLTILIILALIIVVVIVLIVGFIQQSRSSGTINANENPGAYIAKCVQDSLQKTEVKVLAVNGYPNLNSNYILYSGNYNGEKVPYLCKVSLFYTPCVNQEPMLIEKIRKEIEAQTKIDAEVCFSGLISSLRKSGSTVDESPMTLGVSFGAGYILANIDKKLSVKKGDNTQIFEKFNTQIKSPLYNLIDTARTIVNYESTLCDFNTINWELYNKDIQIKKFVASEQTKIYTLTDKNSDKKFSFAVKTCVLPAGL